MAKDEPMEEGDKQAVGNDTDGDADQMLRQRKNSKKESKSRYAECYSKVRIQFKSNQFGDILCATCESQFTTAESTGCCSFSSRHDINIRDCDDECEDTSTHCIYPQWKTTHILLISIEKEKKEEYEPGINELLFEAKEKEKETKGAASSIGGAA